MRPLIEHPTFRWQTRHFATLAAIRSYHRRYGFGPSLRDIATATKLPICTVHAHVKILAADGRIEYTPHKARSIRPKAR